MMSKLHVDPSPRLHVREKAAITILAKMMSKLHVAPSPRLHVREKAAITIRNDVMPPELHRRKTCSTRYQFWVKI
jgi:hypothetical protein